ncbi:MAG TPA: capsule assembly Wzi family protein [Longimicrobiales bacterium]|nr:capsule assembly Wzi family protein [Longimicrobiales bacterium]
MGAQAQKPATTSPSLPADHWSYAVLRRLENAGVLPPGFDIARRDIPQEEVALMLQRAAEADTAAVRAQYINRFREEFPLSSDSAPRVATTLTGFYQRQRGQLQAGIGYDTVWTGARVIEDDESGDVTGRTSFSSKYLGAALAVIHDEVNELQVLVNAGVIGIWGGRREVGYATGYGGGVALSHARLDGVGLFLNRPVRVSVIGALRFEMQVSRIHNVLNLNNRQDSIEPYFWSARGTIQPHPRLRMSLTRGMMFGGERNLPITFSRLVNNLIGNYTENGENSFANQLASIDLHYRLPTSGFPMAVYLEFGADDAYGSFWRTPGTVGGFEIGPFASVDFSVGIERAAFARSSASRSLWYQNSWFREGWTDHGELLGHPLAGHGNEWRLFATSGSALKGWEGAFSGYVRDRGSQNLLAPQREGKSNGGTLELDVRITRRAHVTLNGEVEQGSGDREWTTSKARAALRWFVN